MASGGSQSSSSVANSDVSTQGVAYNYREGKLLFTQLGSGGGGSALGTGDVQAKREQLLILVTLSGLLMRMLKYRLAS